MQGATIGRYRILSEVARGGMGAIYRAAAPDGAPVALKLLLSGRQATPRQRRRFEAEARALLTLRHPGVVALLDAGEHQGVPWLALTWIEGESLERRLERAGPLEPRDVARLGRELADALAHCHAQGVLHRDLKPGNVLLGPDGRALLTDFGLARDLLDPHTLAETDARTLAGAGLGTPGFWAPEQARGELARVGPRSDVYGLGATLYAALTGQAPFDGPSLVAILVAQEQPPAPPGSLRAGIPRGLDAVCLRCLEPDPARRYPDAAALREALDAVLDGRAPRGRSRAPLVAAALLLAGLGLSGATLLAARAPRPEPQAPAPIETPAGPPAAAPPAAPPDPARRAARGIAAAEGPVPPAVEPARRSGALEAVTEGLALTQAGQVGPARAALERAIALDPCLWSAWYNRALIRLESADLDGALTDFSRAVLLAPREPRAWQNRGAMREKMGDLAGAEADLSRVLALAPDFQQVRRDRGVVRARQGDLTGARADLDQVVRQSPLDAEAWFNRGLVLDAQGEHRGAVEDQTRALELGCQRPGYALLCRGNSLSALGEYAVALADLSQARQLLPRDREVGFNLALVFERAGEHRRAREVCDELVSAGPPDARLLALRARALLGLDEPAAALVDAEQALALDPRLPVAHLRRGLALMRLGRPGAREALERYLADAPPDEECRPEATAALSALR